MQTDIKERKMDLTKTDAKEAPKYMEFLDGPANELKPKVNHFLYENLPGNVTIDQMESLACEIYQKVMKIWEFADEKENKGIAL